MSKAQKGQTVNVHYVGTLDDGTEFDNSRARGNTIAFEVGSGQVIQGFDTAVEGMTVGETKSITVQPEDAYGEINPEAFESVPREVFGESVNVEVGSIVKGNNPGTGEEIIAVINEVNDNQVVLDYNHPMAGKQLNFEIELVSLQ